MEARRAFVRPRVISKGGSEPLLLEDEIRPFVEDRRVGAIALVGEAGAGKTTALQHLANAFKRHTKVAFLDEPDAAAVLHGMTARLVVYSARKPHNLFHLASYELAPWGKDDLIEYAKLTHVQFHNARIEDTDFEGAQLACADLSGLKLFQAHLCGTDFSFALLKECDLETVEIPAAKFHGADLTDALLTGSTMPDADFSEACLRNAGLADIDWPRANLRGADLRGVSFHLGSTRSGLVGSPIASEGTRTGFYTDDYEEQHFKAPEEIRKANLRGADLRDANLDGVDFYLVDLRDARIDPKYEAHLRSTGAILDSAGPSD